jgi:phosphate transport system substrate-binding protein
MNKKINLITICLAVSVLVVLSSCSENKKNALHICGSTTIAPFMKKVVLQFKEKNAADIRITAPGSFGGINSFLSGSCDIVMSSSDFLPTHARLAEEKGISIKSFLLGYDIIVPIVNPGNGLTNISLGQLKDIYNGKILNWSELGGKNALIEVVHRNNNSGTSGIWHHIISPATHEDGTSMVSNSSVLATIAENENAIGYISSSFINSEVKPLMVDGIDIGNKLTWTENYPIKRPLFLYVDENKFTATVKTFIIYTLMNEDVKEIFQGSGFFSS